MTTINKPVQIIRNLSEVRHQFQFQDLHIRAAGILLVKKVDEVWFGYMIHERGSWSDPGGKVEVHDMHPYCTGLREFHEETGIPVPLEVKPCINDEYLLPQSKYVLYVRQLADGTDLPVTETLQWVDLTKEQSYHPRIASMMPSVVADLNGFDTLKIVST